MATYTDNYNLTKPTFAESADIRTINGNMDTIDAVMHASQVSLADAYDETRTASNPYKTGDIVMYELLMYKCLGDGVYGTWDGTKWERTTAGANGGGSDVEVTPSYNSGTKIAEIDVDGDTEEIYVPEMTGASSSSDGTAGLPPAPEAGDEDKFFRGDGTWAEVGGGADYVELTQAEYDALSPAEKMNGKMYFVTDGNADTASGGTTSEIIPITAGDGTTSRTFTFDKIPKFIKFYWEDAVVDNGWILDFDIVWGQTYCTNVAHRRNVDIANLSGGSVSLSYSLDGKSVTITAGNAFQACNTSNGSGYMFIDYGSSGGSGGSEDISDMTWTLLTSTSGTGSATAIPSDTKYLVVAVKDTNNGKVTIAAKESISAINKVLDVLGETTYILHGYWKDQSGNDYGDASAQISNGYVTAYSSYNTLTTYVYALS